MASSESPIDHTALIIFSLPYPGYERSFGILLAKVGRDGCKAFDVWMKSKHFDLLFVLFYLLHFFINNHGKQHKILRDDHLEPDGLKQFVLLISLCVKEKWAFFSLITMVGNTKY